MKMWSALKDELGNYVEMKDELGGEVILKFVALRLKTWQFSRR